MEVSSIKTKTVLPESNIFLRLAGGPRQGGPFFNKNVLKGQNFCTAGRENGFFIDICTSLRYNKAERQRGRPPAAKGERR